MKVARGFQAAVRANNPQNIIERHMEKSRELFSDQNNHVKEIASIVGYGNINHFSTMFRREFGCTPSGYMTKKIQ
ncbi:MAG TPA: AraC family transcriptional regulator [Bacillota bacterium]|nr:AraC family transcriptional regulator [Bacillota bacterium]